MSIVNFNDTTPAAPGGVLNIKFLSDASGNISAYDPVGTWQNWTPSYSTGSAMTVSLITLNDAQYLRMGPLVFFKVSTQVSLGGTAANLVAISLPVAMVGFNVLATAAINDGAAVNPGFGQVVTPNGLQIFRPNLVNYAVPGTYTLTAAGFYRCV
ncbi:MAG TPA: hypothetical protein VH601_19205 [Bryobacteraceae bacterium]|jgi:hypothetical protein